MSGVQMSAGDLACVNVAYEPLRREPNHRSELVSEILGEEWLTILERSEGWARVCGEDGYEGWLADWSLAPQTQDGRRELIDRRVGRIGSPRLTLWQSDHWAASPLWLGTTLLTPVDGARRRENWQLLSTTWGAAGWLEDERVASFDARGTAREALRAASSLLGTPYRWGGRTPGGLDCSGLTQLAWSMAGVRLPRDSWQQALIGTAVELDPDAFEPGDLLCFGDPVDHVGLWAGDGHLLHCRGQVRRDRSGEVPELMARLTAVRRPSVDAAAVATLRFVPARP